MPIEVEDVGEEVATEVGEDTLSQYQTHLCQKQCRKGQKRLQKHVVVPLAAEISQNPLQSQ